MCINSCTNATIAEVANKADKTKHANDVPTATAAHNVKHALFNSIGW